MGNLNAKLFMTRRKYDVFAVLLIVSGLWLQWDLSTTLAARPIRHGWEFCLPFFITCFDSGHWTLAADLAIALSLAGAYLLRFDGHRPHLHITTQVSSFVVTLAISIGIGFSLVMFLLAFDPLKHLFG